MKLPWFIAVCLCLLPAKSRAQVTFNATGAGNTYEVISAALGGSPYEVPDCAHTNGFGRHITDAWDDVLGKFVFVFHLHVVPDGDLCTAIDRQRNEIKTYGPSKSYVKAFYGDVCSYRWKFKLDAGFQPSPNFCHIHQIKAGDGSDAGSPIMTVTPRYASPQRLELIYTAPSGLGGSGTKTTAPLADFKGQWIEASERILFATNGTYEITLRRVSDGAVLLVYTNSNLNMWRGDSTFIRPKWGIYRSLNSPSYLRDEQVRFADFCLAKGSDFCVSDIVPPPAFMLSATPASRTVPSGMATNYTVNVDFIPGFTNSVALTVTGLPTNVAASFNPASVTNTANSILSLTSSNNTPPGNYVLTLRGIGGGQTNTNVVTLTISVSTNAVPRLTAFLFSAGNFVLQGINGPPLGAYSLLITTNLTLPPEQWSIVTTGAFDAAGSFALTNPLSVSASSRFYRLKLP